MHTRSLTTRRLAAGLATIALALGACGSDGDGDTDDDATTTTAAAEETTTTADTSDTTVAADEGIDVDGALFLAPPVEESDAGITVSTTEVVSSDGTDPVTVQRRYTTAPDGSLSVSVDAFVAQGEGFEVTAAGDDIRIPSIDELSGGVATSGSSFVELAAEGLEARTDVSYTITSGGTESVTTPLGTFDVQIVDLELTISSSLAGDQTGTVRFSFLPGFGVLKTDTSIAGFDVVSTVVSSTVEP